MKEEINYHKLAEHFVEKMTSDHKILEKDTASLVLSNWAGRFQFLHTATAITLHELEEFNPIGLEQNFKVIRCLLKNGLVKKTPVNKADDSYNHIYYSLTHKFYSAVNDYVLYNEQNWMYIEQWKKYFKIYNENLSLFDEIDAFFKINMHYSNQNYQKANKVKNDYIGKIASEIDFEKRISLKNKAILKIDELVQS